MTRNATNNHQNYIHKSMSKHGRQQSIKGIPYDDGEAKIFFYHIKFPNGWSWGVINRSKSMPKSMAKNIESMPKWFNMVDKMIQRRQNSFEISNQIWETVKPFWGGETLFCENEITAKWTILKIIKKRSQNNAKSMLEKTRTI